MVLGCSFVTGFCESHPLTSSSTDVLPLFICRPLFVSIDRYDIMKMGKRCTPRESQAQLFDGMLGTPHRALMRHRFPVVCARTSMDRGMHPLSIKVWVQVPPSAQSYMVMIITGGIVQRSRHNIYATQSYLRQRTNTSIWGTLW